MKGYGQTNAGGTETNDGSGQVPDGRTSADRDRYIVDIVRNAMLTTWNSICDDTHCHPLDIEHGKGKYLIFKPAHWAEMAGQMVWQNLRDLYATPAPSLAPGQKTVKERLSDVFTWMREPDWTEVASFDWLMDWMNRRPIADVAMIAMLTPEDAAEWRPIDSLRRADVDTRLVLWNPCDGLHLVNVAHTGEREIGMLKSGGIFTYWRKLSPPPSD